MYNYWRRRGKIASLRQQSIVHSMNNRTRPGKHIWELDLHFDLNKH